MARQRRRGAERPSAGRRPQEDPRRRDRRSGVPEAEAAASVDNHHARLAAEDTTPEVAAFSPVPLAADVNLRRGLLAAAYEVGQHLNRLHFFAVQAWMFDRWSIVGERPEFQALPRFVQRCVDGVRYQEEFSNAVRQRLDDLASTFGHDEHCDDACVAIRRIARHLDGLPITNEALLLDDIDRDITRTPAGFVNDVRDQIDARFDEQQRRIMRFAEMIDQAAYPRTICREILEDMLERQQPADGDVVLTWEGVGNSRPDPNRLSWPAQPYDASRRLPPARWYEEVHHLFEVAGIPNEAIAPRLEQVRSLSDVGRVAESVDSLHADVQQALSPTIAPYLGLRFEDGNLRLTRDGLEGSIGFGRQRLLYGLIKFLSQRGEQWTGRQLLRNSWRSFGETSRPKNSTIDNAIERLRDLLSSDVLSICITSQFPSGFRLEAGRADRSSRLR
jgi:hypothetical protein